MAGPTLDLLTRALTAWTLAVRRRAGVVIAAFAVLVVASGAFAVRHLQIDTDTSAMLSPDLPWRQAEIAFAKAFPGREHGIVAVIDGDTPEQADAAVAALLPALKQRAELKDADLPAGMAFFGQNGLLYLEAGELDALATDLERAQPFFGHLASDPSVAGLMQLIAALLQEQRVQLPVELPAVLDPISEVISAQAQGRSAALSWQSLVAPGRLPADKRRFVLAHARDTEHEPDGVQAFREVIAQHPSPGARVRLTGEVPLWMDELSAAAQGAIASALAALLLGAGFLYWGLRSLRLVAICLAALVGGLVVTAGFAAAAVGKLNLISVAFSTLYIGIAIDYGVQLCMRYRELRSEGTAPGEALTETGGRFGGALVLCALATVAGFLSFAPTDYRGVAELGLIAGSGIVIGLVTSLTLLPALLEAFAPATVVPMGRSALRPLAVRLASLPVERPAAVRIAALVLAAVSLALLPRLRFDHNPMHLKPPRTESLQAYDDLVKEDGSPMAAAVLAGSPQEAAALMQKLGALKTVRRAISFPAFVPQDQDPKLGTLESLQLALGVGLPEHLALKPADPARDAPALAAARDAARAYKGEAAASAAAGRLADAIDGWLKSRSGADAAAMTGLRDALLGGLPPLLRRLHAALGAQAVTLDSLPADLRREWVSADGRYKVEATPAEDLNDDAALLRFVADVQAVAPAATGAAIDYVEGARAVIGAFEQAFIAALVMIVVILLALLRDVRDTLRALAPLVLGSLLLMALLAATGQPLNFANIIALPLLLGVGVDIGVLILWRARHPAPGDRNPVLTGTGAAVLISVLATLASFASLMLSVHRGMASLGLLLTLGLLIYLSCTFLVLPALLPAPPRPEKPSQ